MARDDSRPPRDPERKRNGAPGPSRSSQRGAAAIPGRGRSGYGLESIRPHLRAQIEYSKLWRPTFPPERNDEDEDN